MSSLKARRTTREVKFQTDLEETTFVGGDGQREEYREKVEPARVCDQRHADQRRRCHVVMWNTPGASRALEREQSETQLCLSN